MSIDDGDLSRRALLLMASAACMTTWPGCAPAATRNDKEAAAMSSSERDFDFLRGHWRVHHRRLRDRLAGSTEWDEFLGRCSMQTVMGGFGNVDDNLLHLPGGDYRAAAMRAFDPKTRRWAIWWLDGRNPHTIDAPVIGSFENGVGVFEADDTYKGRPVRVRFTWSETHTASPRWAQAFSADGGKTWETNWTMRFERIAGENGGPFIG
jgi:hypothetical protein